MDELELRAKAEEAFKAGVAMREKFKGRAPTSEETAAATKAFDEAERYLSAADLLKKEAGIKASLEATLERRPHGAPEVTGAVGVSTEDARLKALVMRAIKSGKGGRQANWGLEKPEEVKALNSISDKEGALLLEEEMLPGIVAKLRDIVKFRQYATVVTTSAAMLSLLTEDFDPDMPTSKEGGTVTVEDITNWLGKTNFTPHKRSRIWKMPDELLADSKFNLERFWVNRFAVRLGEIEENDYINGNGKGKPLGLLAVSLNTRNATGSSGAAVAADDLINLQGDIKEQYQPNAAFLIGRATFTAVRLLKDSQNRYLWEPSYQAGAPATLLGKPVIVSEFMPTPTNGDATKPFMVYGNLEHYTIVDRGAFAVKRLDELYAAEGKVGIRVDRRYDGAPVLKDPFIKLLKVA